MTRTTPDGDSRHELGRRGEDAAVRYLEARGFVVMGRNVRTRSTEFDVVARDHEGLVFVEVKTRRNARYGHPYQAVDAAKRRRMELGALEFMDAADSAEINYRFAVASILVLESGQLHLEWIEDV